MQIILAIIVIESGGNDYAVGDSGKSYGCMQMTQAYVQDAADFDNVDWAVSYTHLTLPTICSV